MTRGFKALLVGLLAWLLANRVFTHGSVRELAFALSWFALAAALVYDARSQPADTKRTRVWRLLACSSVATALVIDGVCTISQRGSFAPWSLWALACLGTTGLVTRISWERVRDKRAGDRACIERQVVRSLKTALSVALLAALNLVIFQHDLKKDVSFSPATQPSAQVAALAKKIDEPLEVVLFLDPTDALWPAIAPYFNGLAALSPKIRVRVSEASREPELVREHRVRGNGWGLLRMGARAETIEVGRDLAHARTTLKMLDAHVANHLSALLIEARHVYLTRGHGERSVIGDVEESRGRKLADFSRLLARFNLSMSSLGIAEGLGRDVPSDAALVLVLGPERAFMPEEAAALERYVERGGHLWLALEPSLDVGLSALSERMGVYPTPGVVLCRDSHLVRNRSDADRELIVARDFKTHEVTRLAQRAGKRDGVVFIRAAGLRVEREGRSAPATTLLTASEDCFLDLDGDFQQSASEPDVAPTLMAAWTNPRGAKVFVVGDGDLPTDQVLRSDANTFVTMGALSWLLGGDVLNVPILPDEEMPIVHERGEDRIWFYATSFAMPALLFAMSFVAARRSRKRAS